MFDWVLNAPLSIGAFFKQKVGVLNQCRNASIQKQSPKGVLQKIVPNIFKKFTGKNLCRSFFLNKVAGRTQQANTELNLEIKHGTDMPNVYKIK